MGFWDGLKAAVGIGTSVAGSTASKLANMAVTVPSTAIDTSLSTIPVVINAPNQAIETAIDVAQQVIMPKVQEAPMVTVPQIEAPTYTPLKVEGYETETDKTTAEELLELLPMGGLALLSFLL